MVAGHGQRGGRRSAPEVTATPGPLWGYHVDDVNLALGNLVADVGSEEGAYH